MKHIILTKYVFAALIKSRKTEISSAHKALALGLLCTFYSYTFFKRFQSN